MAMIYQFMFTNFGRGCIHQILHDLVQIVNRLLSRGVGAAHRLLSRVICLEEYLEDINIVFTCVTGWLNWS